MFNKYIISLVLALTLIMALVLPVSAAPPSEESWQCAAFNNGAAVIGYNINTTNLQVSSFWIDNRSDQPIYLFVSKNGEIIFELSAAPYAGLVSKPINNFKFQRLPATDPDDPDSIRYPNGVTISVRYG